MDVVSRSKDILLKLCAQSDEASSVAIRQGLEIVVVAQERPIKPLVAAMTLGDRAPLVATAVGKSMLAFMGDEAIADIIRQSGKQKFNILKPKSAAALRTELAGIRAGALATNSEEWMEGVNAIALPVLSQDGPVASVAVAAPVVRMTKKWLAAVEPLLRQAAQDLSVRMGGPTGAQHR